MKRLVALSLAALVFAGCGGDEGAAPTTGVATATTPVADTTIATTTAPRPSSSSTTTVVPTTLPATTTTVPTEDLIKQAVQDYATAYHLCGEKPAECVPESFTAVQGRSRTVVTDLASGMAEQGLYFSPDARGSYVVAESVTLRTPTEASASFCAFDAGAVMGPNGPDGLPTVVNDEIASVRYEFALFLEGTQWRVGLQHQTARLGEGSLCPPPE